MRNKNSDVFQSEKYFCMFQNIYAAEKLRGPEIDPRTASPVGPGPSLNGVETTTKKKERERKETSRLDCS
jgi:hypothetical protein